MAKKVPGLYRRGRIWWCKYYVNGVPHRESTGTEKFKEAESYLEAKKAARAKGAAVLPRADRILYEEIAADLRTYYETTGKRDLAEAESRLAHLDRFFGKTRVVAITPSRITAYVQARQREGASNATINRDLATLSRMLTLGYRNGTVLRVPPIEKLKEADPRSGFFEEAEALAVARHLAPDLQLAVTLAYKYGWRMQSEVLTRERRHLDLEAGTLRLDPGETKNGKGRVVYLTPELIGLVRGQLERVEAHQKRSGRVVPFLFPYLRGRRAGQRRKDFRKAWASACEKAGVSGRLRHDFRRTAVRNMVNAGVPERVAMAVTGHQTRAVFDRYHIVSPADLQDVARKLTGTFTGTIATPDDSQVLVSREGFEPSTP